ncbi:MAG: hypothetical protein FWF99_00070 [Desulfovibrionaceae bacterium]|nr:hypothetical protein [Desulfovibrionaceae bacterium]
MSRNTDIYKAVRDFIETALNALPGVPETGLQVEIAEGEAGEEWTGIRMKMNASGAVAKRYIDGTRLETWSFELLSKQAIVPDGAEYIAFAVYLEELSDRLQDMARRRIIPQLPAGVKFKAMEAAARPAQVIATEKYSGYALDLRFNLLCEG